MTETTRKRKYRDQPRTTCSRTGSASTTLTDRPKRRSGGVSHSTAHTSETTHSRHKSTIRITQEDHDRILSLLQSIDWSMAKNTSRQNVIRENDPNTLKKGKKPYCQSFIFGRNMKDPNYEYSYWSLQYPAIYQELQNFFAKYTKSQFRYTHITLNKNLQCKRHTDGGNMGLSYIIAIGNYTGGALRVERDEHHPNDVTIHDLHRTFVLFNGKEQPHETLPFTGERYTLVYYTSDIVPKEGLCNNNTIMKKSPEEDGDDDHRSKHALPATPNTTVQHHDSTAASTLTAKFHAMKKKLGRKR